MSVSRKKIVMVDDDEKLLALVARYLREHGCQVSTVIDSTSGQQLVQAYEPDLVVLDVMMPGLDGFSLCKEIRRENDVPVIMVTARGAVDDRIQGLKSGADDYVLKPFEPRELLARIETVLRRASRGKVDEASSRVMRFSGDLEIDLEARSAKLKGHALSLTTTEFDILFLFARHSGQILSRSEIMDKLRGVSWSVFNRSIDLAVSRLRQKLGDNPRDPTFFKTVWGEGYLFIAKAEGTWARRFGQSGS